jgi:hypothetical protein
MTPMLRVSVAIVLAALSVAGVAAAQEPTFTLTPYAPPPTASVLAPGAAADSSALPPDAASLAFRLALISSMYPVGPAFGTGGCGALSVAAAGTILPTQPYTQIQLTPRLVLHGFSDLGCPGDPYASLDAGMGGGLTYAMPLRPALWLVGSAGAYGVPAHDVVPARAVVGGGLDLVTKTKDNRVFTTGIGLSARGGGVRIIPRVGGTF